MSKKVNHDKLGDGVLNKTEADNVNRDINNILYEIDKVCLRPLVYFLKSIPSGFVPLPPSSLIAILEHSENENLTSSVGPERTIESEIKNLGSNAWLEMVMNTGSVILNDRYFNIYGDSSSDNIVSTYGEAGQHEDGNDLTADEIGRKDRVFKTVISLRQMLQIYKLGGINNENVWTALFGTRIKDKNGCVSFKFVMPSFLSNKILVEAYTDIVRISEPQQNSMQIYMYCRNIFKSFCTDIITPRILIHANIFLIWNSTLKDVFNTEFYDKLISDIIGAPDTGSDSASSLVSSGIFPLYAGLLGGTLPSLLLLKVLEEEFAKYSVLVHLIIRVFGYLDRNSCHMYSNSPDLSITALIYFYKCVFFPLSSSFTAALLNIITVERDFFIQACLRSLFSPSLNDQKIFDCMDLPDYNPEEARDTEEAEEAESILDCGKDDISEPKRMIYSWCKKESHFSPDLSVLKNNLVFENYHGKSHNSVLFNVINNIINILSCSPGGKISLRRTNTFDSGMDMKSGFRPSSSSYSSSSSSLSPSNWSQDEDKMVTGLNRVSRTVDPLIEIETKMLSSFYQNKLSGLFWFSKEENDQAVYKSAVEKPLMRGTLYYYRSRLEELSGFLDLKQICLFTNWILCEEETRVTKIFPKKSHRGFLKLLEGVLFYFVSKKLFESYKRSMSSFILLSRREDEDAWDRNGHGRKRALDLSFLFKGSIRMYINSDNYCALKSTYSLFIKDTIRSNSYNLLNKVLLKLDMSRKHKKLEFPIGGPNLDISKLSSSIGLGSDNSSVNESNSTYFNNGCCAGSTQTGGDVKEGGGEAKGEEKEGIKDPGREKGTSSLSLPSSRQSCFVYFAYVIYESIFEDVTKAMKLEKDNLKTGARNESVNISNRFLSIQIVLFILTRYRRFVKFSFENDKILRKIINRGVYDGLVMHFQNSISPSNHGFALFMLSMWFNSFIDNKILQIYEIFSSYKQPKIENPEQALINGTSLLLGGVGGGVMGFGTRFGGAGSGIAGSGQGLGMVGIGAPGPGILGSGSGLGVMGMGAAGTGIVGSGSGLGLGMGVGVGMGVGPAVAGGTAVSFGGCNFPNFNSLGINIGPNLCAGPGIGIDGLNIGNFGIGANIGTGTGIDVNNGLYLALSQVVPNQFYNKPTTGRSTLRLFLKFTFEWFSKILLNRYSADSEPSTISNFTSISTSILEDLIRSEKNSKVLNTLINNAIASISVLKVLPNSEIVISHYKDRLCKRLIRISMLNENNPRTRLREGACSALQLCMEYFLLLCLDRKVVREGEGRYYDNSGLQGEEFGLNEVLQVASENFGSGDLRNETRSKERKDLDQEGYYGLNNDLVNTSLKSLKSLLDDFTTQEFSNLCGDDWFRVFLTSSFNWRKVNNSIQSIVGRGFGGRYADDSIGNNFLGSRIMNSAENLLIDSCRGFPPEIKKEMMQFENEYKRKYPHRKLNWLCDNGFSVLRGNGFKAKLIGGIEGFWRREEVQFSIDLEIVCSLVVAKVLLGIARLGEMDFRLLDLEKESSGLPAVEILRVLLSLSLPGQKLIQIKNRGEKIEMTRERIVYWRTWFSEETTFGLEDIVIESRDIGIVGRQIRLNPVMLSRELFLRRGNNCESYLNSLAFRYMFEKREYFQTIKFDNLENTLKIGYPWNSDFVLEDDRYEHYFNCMSDIIGSDDLFYSVLDESNRQGSENSHYPEYILFNGFKYKDNFGILFEECCNFESSNQLVMFSYGNVNGGEGGLFYHQRDVFESIVNRETQLATLLNNCSPAKTKINKEPSSKPSTKEVLGSDGTKNITFEECGIKTPGAGDLEPLGAEREETSQKKRRISSAIGLSDRVYLDNNENNSNHKVSSSSSIVYADSPPESQLLNYQISGIIDIVCKLESAVVRLLKKSSCLTYSEIVNFLENKWSQSSLGSSGISTENIDQALVKLVKRDFIKFSCKHSNQDCKCESISRRIFVPDGGHSSEIDMNNTDSNINTFTSNNKDSYTNTGTSFLGLFDPDSVFEYVQ
ncbi:Cullin family protein [Cryptosporidium felis]|nr:Cullin family protein [Cryptosporidium felis]